MQTLEGHKDAIFCMVSKGDSIYSGGADGYVARWNPDRNNDGSLFAQFGHAVYALYASEKHLMVGCSNGVLYQLSTTDQKLVNEADLRSGGIFSIVPTENGWLIGTQKGAVFFLNEELEVQGTLLLSQRSIRSIIPINQHWVAVCSSGNYHAFGLSDIFLREEIHTRPALVVSKNPYTQDLVSGGCDAILRVVTPGEFEEKSAINAHLYHIHSIAFHPNIPVFLSSSLDKSIKLWSAEDYQLLKVVEISKGFGHTNSVNKVLWIGDNRFISCSDDRKMMVWNADLPS